MELRRWCAWATAFGDRLLGPGACLVLCAPLALIAEVATAGSGYGVVAGAVAFVVGAAALLTAALLHVPCAIARRIHRVRVWLAYRRRALRDPGPLDLGPYRTPGK
jgi:hypothetical protein